MTNKFENLNKAWGLLDDAKRLETFHNSFNDATKKGNKGRIDKFKKGFNADDRFRSFQINIYFSAYTGEYGSSTVSEYLSLNSGEAGNALIKYLKDNEEAVIKGMADILNEKAKSLLVSAQSEVDSASSLIQEIKTYNPSSHE